MALFIFTLIKYLIIGYFVFLLINLMLILLEKILINFNIPSEKTVLAIGDSHIKNALNDEILTNVFNFSEGTSSYLYSYLKINKMLKDNPHIDTLILGYCYRDISIFRNRWIVNAKFIKMKLPNHLFLFDLEDFIFLFKINPKFVFINFHGNIIDRIKFLTSDKKLNRWGGYLSVERDNLAKQIKNLHLRRKVVAKYSRIQAKYLIKIYQLAMENKIKLILLNVPIHPEMEKRQKKLMKRYFNFAKKRLPNAILINHSSKEIPDSGFGDLVHLNFYGAGIYSEYLKNNYAEYFGIKK